MKTETIIALQALMARDKDVRGRMYYWENVVSTVEHRIAGGYSKWRIGVLMRDCDPFNDRLEEDQLREMSNDEMEGFLLGARAILESAQKELAAIGAEIEAL